MTYVARDEMRAALASGRPLPRMEDPALLRGEGRYADDRRLPGEVHAVFVRSTVAHGILRSVETAAALTLPDVLAVYTADDLAAAGLGPILNLLAFNNRDGSAMHKPPRHALASGRVRYVGDPVAMVVARTEAAARDAAEAVLLDIDPLPAVIRAADAAAPGAPQLYDDVPGNRCLEFFHGDSAAVDRQFAAAAHVAKVSVDVSRIVVSPMEPRAGVAAYDAGTGQYTLWTGTQGVFAMRNALARDVLHVPPASLRILTGNVGGSFGMKSPIYPEYVCLLHAARALGYPVRWADQRSESFVSDFHGRDLQVDAALALDKDGRFLAVRIDGVVNLGGYLTQTAPIMGARGFMRHIAAPYRVPCIEFVTRSVFTNTAPIGAYRGAGRPEGNYVMERLVEIAAAQMGIDSLDLRRRNLVRPADMPYAAPTGVTYDCGDGTRLLDRATAAADWSGFPARAAASRRKGRLRGRGIGQYLEVTAPPVNEMCRIRFDGDRSVTIVTGTLDYGQGHLTPFAQVLADRLGIPLDRVRLVQGDSDELVAGGGTVGSKSLMASGTAIVEASLKVIENGRQLASAVLEAAPVDIEFVEGQFRVAGTDKSIHILDLARIIETKTAIPDDLPRSLDASYVLQAGPEAFPNGCHVAEVEIDPETGVVDLVRYVMVNDFGVVISPMIVEGQLHGGVAQGFGQVVLEQTSYDESGQLLSGSFLDYALPRASDLPFFEYESMPIPTTANPLGVKGCGEAGCAGSLPSIMNAIIDALAPLGVKDIQMPATPSRLWAIIDEARRTHP
jgi:carbon-monoxide dehydrogenase large subunit